jgi:hypothetical protein
VILSINFLSSLLKFAFAVISPKKDDAYDKKGKGSEIAKWEADLRKSLANKKASTTASLTKEEQAVLRAQLEKEALVRRRVSVVKANLERGLHFIHSLMTAGVPDFRSYISPMTSLLLDGALQTGSALVGRHAFDTYIVGDFFAFDRTGLRLFCRSFPNAAQIAWIPSQSGSG